jgi:hypothetical protein
MFTIFSEKERKKGPKNSETRKNRTALESGILNCLQQESRATPNSESRENRTPMEAGILDCLQQEARATPNSAKCAMQIRFCERKKGDPSSAMRGGRQSATGNWQPEQKDGSNVAPAAGKTDRRAGGRTDGRTDGRTNPATGLDEDCRRFQSRVLSRIGWATYFTIY